MLCSKPQQIPSHTFHTGGTPGAPRPPARNLCIEHGGVKLCKVPTCAKMDRGRGFCSKHGNLLGLGGLKCTAPDCTKAGKPDTPCPTAES